MNIRKQENSWLSLEKNMEYEVVLTTQAKVNFRQIINYLLYELKSEQAATNVANDMENTINRLAHIAGSLKLCEDYKLRNLGYRMIHFKRHKYFMLYRIEGNRVYVDSIYHDLQDYEQSVR